MSLYQLRCCLSLFHFLQWLIRHLPWQCIPELLPPHSWWLECLFLGKVKIIQRRLSINLHESASLGRGHRRNVCIDLKKPFMEKLKIIKGEEYNEHWCTYPSSIFSIEGNFKLSNLNQLKANLEKVSGTMWRWHSLSEFKLNFPNISSVSNAPPPIQKNLALSFSLQFKF